MARNKFDVDEELREESEFNMKDFVRLLKYTEPYKKRMIWTVVFMIITSILSLAAPIFLKIAIDDYIPGANIGGIVILAVLLVVFNLISIFFTRYRIENMAHVGQGIIRDLRLDLFKNLQRLPFTYYDDRPHGKILVRVVNYVNSLSDLLSNGIVNLITELFSVVVIIAAMFILNVRLTLIVLVGLPFLFLAINIIRAKQRVAWRIQSAKQSNMNAYIHESISGVKVTQGFTREAHNMEIMDDVLTSVRSSWMKAVRVQFLVGPAAENISSWTTSALFVFSAAWIANDVVSVGTLIAFVSYVWRFWAPINTIAGVYNNIVVNGSYLERIFETIDEPVLVKDIQGAVTMPPMNGNVKFEHVTFSYEEGHPTLNDVSFDVKSGETIALVGPTGAGKTTIVNLLSRFYDLNSGKIYIDGVDIKTVTLNSLRSQMGIMLQDSFIFSGTIMDNIRYGKLDATDEQVIVAAKAVKAHDFIVRMENGYETEVNERGSRLSVGQRQLISFARALLADPKILILDEATSSIDTKTEEMLQEGLKKLLDNRTSFIIAHRLSTIKNADCIMYVDNGTIIEAGTHEELLANEGAYYKLHKAQYDFLKS